YVSDGPLRRRTGPLHCRIQPPTQNGNNGSTLRCDAAGRPTAVAEDKPEAVGRRDTRPLSRGDPRPQLPQGTTQAQRLAGKCASEDPRRAGSWAVRLTLLAAQRRCGLGRGRRGECSQLVL